MRSRCDARSILRSWMKWIGEVPRVRWTARCSIRSLTPMAFAARGMLISSARRSRAHRSKAATVGSLCARALGMV